MANPNYLRVLIRRTLLLKGSAFWEARYVPAEWRAAREQESTQELILQVCDFGPEQAVSPKIWLTRWI